MEIIKRKKYNIPDYPQYWGLEFVWNEHIMLTDNSDYSYHSGYIALADGKTGKDIVHFSNDGFMYVIKNSYK